MIFNCSKQELTKALQIVSKALNNKPQAPILSGIYLEAKNNKLTLQATDYDIGINCSILSDIEEEGTLVLAGKYFNEMIRTMPGENINITYNAEQNTAIIKSNNTKFNLLSMPSSEYPVLQKLTGNTQFKLRNNILTDLIKKTSFACSNEAARPIFTGCLLEMDEACLTMAATNTHRLAVKKEILDINSDYPAEKLIIPSRILNDLVTLLASDIPSDVLITCSNNQISFTYENIYIVSRLIEGQFPDYRNVIPNGFQTHVQIKTKELQEAIERVSLISRLNEYNIIKFTFTQDNILISSDNPEIGHAEENLPINLVGTPISISFNAKYILEALKYVGAEQVVFSFNQSLSPASIAIPDNDLFIYVVTPVRTSN